MSQSRGTSDASSPIEGDDCRFSVLEETASTNRGEIYCPNCGTHNSHMGNPAQVDFWTSYCPGCESRLFPHSAIYVDAVNTIPTAEIMREHLNNYWAELLDMSQQAIDSTLHRRMIKMACQEFGWETAYYGIS